MNQPGIFQYGECQIRERRSHHQSYFASMSTDLLDDKIRGMPLFHFLMNRHSAQGSAKSIFSMYPMLKKQWAQDRLNRPFHDWNIVLRTYQLQNFTSVIRSLL